jgi:hypothetical protein
MTAPETDPCPRSRPGHANLTCPVPSAAGGSPSVRSPQRTPSALMTWAPGYQPRGSAPPAACCSLATSTTTAATGQHDLTWAGAAAHGRLAFVLSPRLRAPPRTAGASCCPDGLAGFTLVAGTGRCRPTRARVATTREATHGRWVWRERSGLSGTPPSHPACEVRRISGSAGVGRRPLRRAGGGWRPRGLR